MVRAHDSARPCYAHGVKADNTVVGVLANFVKISKVWAYGFRPLRAIDLVT
jgi:hypothetical protein